MYYVPANYCNSMQNFNLLFTFKFVKPLKQVKMIALDEKNRDLLVKDHFGDDERENFEPMVPVESKVKCSAKSLEDCEKLP